MSREEEIIKTAKFIYSPSSGIPQSLPMRVGFIEGAKWADKNPDSNGKELLYVAQKTAERTKKEIISKACEWLEEKNKMCMYELEMILGDKFINDFKKAMEK